MQTMLREKTTDDSLRLCLEIQLMCSFVPPANITDRQWVAGLIEQLERSVLAESEQFHDPAPSNTRDR